MAESTTGITEVEVLRRWRGSPVNGPADNRPGEHCGLPDALADELANIPESMGGPAVKIIRRNVPKTEGIDAHGVVGGDQARTRGDVLIELMTELLQEFRRRDGGRKN